MSPGGAHGRGDHRRVEQPTTLELAATSSERRVCTTRRGRRGPIEYLYLNATALDTRWAARSKTLRP
jgi:hypothetical protein